MRLAALLALNKLSTKSDLITTRSYGCVRIPGRREIHEVQQLTRRKSLITRTDLVLLTRTAVHLRPGQMGQRARLRTQRIAMHCLPSARRWLLAGPNPAGASTWPNGFRPVDAGLWRNWRGLAALRNGHLDLLGVSRRLTVRPGAGRTGPGWAGADWDQASAPTLWRFHLYYWDWAWALAEDADQSGARALFAALWRSWHEAIPAGRGVAWLPYPTALRAWSWCGLYGGLVAGSKVEDAFLASLAAHAGFLRRHLELDVGGNHLIKNLKALAGLAVFFEDERMLSRALSRLSRSSPCRCCRTAAITSGRPPTTARCSPTWPT